MKKPLAIVSDHALIRYLERVLMLDVEAHRQEIGRKVDRAVRLGAAAVVIDGMRYVLRNGRVTTILPRDTNQRPPDDKGGWA